MLQDLPKEDHDLKVEDDTAMQIDQKEHRNDE
jgi:hypothetical protein